MISDLNSLAKSLVVRVNEIHRGGYSLNNKGPHPDGTDFFSVPDNGIRHD
jgi:flagellar hook-associated protein 1 FlgK